MIVPEDTVFFFLILKKCRGRAGPGLTATNDDDRDAKMLRDEHKALNTGGKASPMGPHQTLKFLGLDNC